MEMFNLAALADDRRVAREREARSERLRGRPRRRSRSEAARAVEKPRVPAGLTQPNRPVT